MSYNTWRCVLRYAVHSGEVITRGIPHIGHLSRQVRVAFMRVPRQIRQRLPDTFGLLHACMFDRRCCPARYTSVHRPCVPCRYSISTLSCGFLFPDGHDGPFRHVSQGKMSGMRRMTQWTGRGIGTRESPDVMIPPAPFYEYPLAAVPTFFVLHSTLPCP